MSVSLYGSGQTILQVVPSIQTLGISTTSTSYVTTGLTATITPQSTTSKILIMTQLTGIAPSGTNGGGFAIYRNGSSVWVPSQADATGPYMIYTAAGSSSNVTIPLNYVDSPASTSAQTYAIYWRAYTSATAFNLGGPGAATVGQHSLILMEISGS